MSRFRAWRQTKLELVVAYALPLGRRDGEKKSSGLSM